MGKKSLEDQLKWVLDLLKEYRESRRMKENSLENAQQAFDKASEGLDLAERTWRETKSHRDSALIEVAYLDEKIKDCEAERRLLESKLAEVRADELAKR